MTLASSKVPQILSAALQRIQSSPDLTSQDAERVRQFAIRLITEFSLAKASEVNSPKATLLPSQNSAGSSAKVQEVLSAAMHKVQNSPDLTSQDADWVRQFAIHLIAELSVMKAEDAKNPTPPDYLRVSKTPSAVSIQDPTPQADPLGNTRNPLVGRTEG